MTNVVFVVLSVALVVMGLLLLAGVLIRVLRVLRRFRNTSSMVATSTSDRAGLLRARSAGLRVAWDQRRGAPGKIHS